jgi:hypothetical protein
VATNFPSPRPLSIPPVWNFWVPSTTVPYAHIPAHDVFPIHLQAVFRSVSSERESAGTKIPTARLFLIIRIKHWKRCITTAVVECHHDGPFWTGGRLVYPGVPVKDVILIDRTRPERIDGLDGGWLNWLGRIPAFSDHLISCNHWYWSSFRDCRTWDTGDVLRGAHPLDNVSFRCYLRFFSAAQGVSEDPLVLAEGVCSRKEPFRVDCY